MPTGSSSRVRDGRRRFSRWGGVALAAVLAAGAAGPAPAGGQLISPGELSAAHAGLEGLRNCTQCHRLRQKGVDRELCLGCHTPLAHRIRGEAGFHATLAERDCAACHKDHFGREFDVLRLDTLAFDHDRTGYGLTGLHRDTGCRECHTASLVEDPAVRAFKTDHGALERTFLGLPTACVSCHMPDDPHQDQFAGEGCEDCHDTDGWSGARGFNHDETRYRLTGMHREVTCAECHPPLEGVPRSVSGTAGPSPSAAALRFSPLPFQRCADCHQDPHGGSMPGTCASCHDTGGWYRVDRARVESSFDHRATGFALEGTHARTPCVSCHDDHAAARLQGIRIRYDQGTRGRPYPRPVAGGCGSCHEDAHAGDFAARADGGDCRSCHGQDGWLPADYGLDRHLAEAAFPLEGAHLVTPCAGCHRSPEGALVIRLGDFDCVACHTPDDPHGDQFRGRGCLECHGLEAFTIPSFDHDT
ncbi:MAG TPA: cytochrome c3 family protein, partial [Longimicrobiales bacterium]|nr:cytochrome c3 family protein [Longimicrobiales bacterium]